MRSRTSDGVTRSCRHSRCAQSRLDQFAQMRRRRGARRHQLLGILVAQFVERERAALGEGERRIGQLARIERGQPRARAQVPLAVGEERVTALGERRAQADRR